jgi:hypothetical protein
MKRTKYDIEADDGEQCSASAATVVIQSDEDGEEEHIVGTIVDMARKAGSKKAAAKCEACDESIVHVATCLSGNTKLCETCDLAEWAAGMCSACGNAPVTQHEPLCSAQLCDACDISLWVVRQGFM